MMSYLNIIYCTHVHVQDDFLNFCLMNCEISILAENFGFFKILKILISFFCFLNVFLCFF